MAIDIVQWILLALDFLSTHNIESGPKSMNRKGENVFRRSALFFASERESNFRILEFFWLINLFYLLTEKHKVMSLRTALTCSTHSSLRERSLQQEHFVVTADSRVTSETARVRKWASRASYKTSAAERRKFKIIRDVERNRIASPLRSFFFRLCHKFDNLKVRTFKNTKRIFRKNI